MFSLQNLGRHDHLPRPFLVHTPPLNAARLRSSPRTPHTHHRIDTKRVHDVLDKIRGVDRIAEVRRGLGPPASNVAPASVPPQAPPPAPVAAPVAAQVSTTTSAETLDPSPVFHELPPSTPQSITKTVNDSRTIYSSPYLRTPQNKQMGIVSAPATLRRPKRRLSEASEPPPKRNAPETPWHLDDSPSLVYGAPVTPPQWTRIQWQYLSVLANLIPELDQGSLEDVKTFIDTSLPQWLVKEFHPFREELPSRLMALVKWNRTAKPGASDNLALTREVWDQVRGLMTKLLPVFRAENKVTLENADDYAQKLVSVAELVKRSMAPAKLHQYNKLEVARQVYAPQDEFQLDKQKIQYRVPKLTICISSTPLDLGSDWTGQ
ncbi:hypothetical protein B9G98_01236 [Wickerhamiella sorbophila]|uniref:Uncharacterized protein n=1 Tax=Wickerhamiella sorbophila TaxID=45607 RepID=A0A2T0FF42_9ASCO|nr:hypothetical protein B9G98_01236 [Wickerhamiella sorbophila]PRT53616.1 hypothetical protein B9G98_01236 [Wickerhamiella sorbophila]